MRLAPLAENVLLLLPQPVADARLDEDVGVMVSIVA